MISSLLQNKSYGERVQLKSSEIVKCDFVGEYTINNIKIDIQSIKEIEGGIEVLARAWKNDVQLGFGIDGMIDIERFKIINPPILVDDPLGDIVIEVMNNKGDNTIRILKENPKQAIIETLIKIVKNVGKTSTKIKKDSIGNTTSTYFSFNDFQIYTSNATWSTAHDAPSGTIAVSTDSYVQITDNTNYFIARYFAYFATTDLGGESISSVTLTVTSINNKGGTITAYNVFSSTASNPLVDADFDLCGTTDLASDIAVADFPTTGTAVWTFNPTGIAYINLTSNTILSIRESNFDAPNISPGSTSGFNQIGFKNSSQAGTSSDPFLTVVHTTATSGPANLKTYDTNVKANIKSINTNLISNVKTLDTNA